jgi:hypothetical protein
VTIDVLRYPIGKFDVNAAVTPLHRQEAIETIAALPSSLRVAVRGLTDAQIDTPYREGGWTVRQVVHHVVDSHMNAYIRFKLTLTEETPTIKPYEEARWAELPDVRTMPVENSLAFLDLLHDRWVTLLRVMTDVDFARTFYHPERQQEISLNVITAMYAWHSKHHTAHITALRKRMGWAA